MNKSPRYLSALVCSLGLLFGSLQIQAKETLTVGYLPILDHLTLLVSHSRDNASFREVEISPKLFRSWGEMAGALKAGVVDAAFILSPLAMELYNAGTPLRSILLAHRDGSAITVKAGSDIRSAADLKGKKVAIPYKVSTHTALLNKYLGNDGLSLNDITTRVIAPPNMLKAMQAGFIDAFIVAEPFGAKAQSKGLGNILVLTKDIVPNHVECIVVVRQEVLRKAPAAVQEWTASLVRAGRFIDQDKLENGSKSVAGMTARKYWPHAEQDIINGLQNPSDRISFSDLNPAEKDFQVIVDISRQAKLIEKVDLSGFITPEFYQSALTQ